MERLINPIPSQNSPAAQPPQPPPTTFVQADPHTFRDLVQRLTGAADSPDKLPITASARPAVGPKRPAFKLQDRRPSVRKLEIKLGLTSIHSPRPYSQRSPQPSPTHQQQKQFLVAAAAGYGTSPFPSPVTPLSPNTVFSPSVLEEERAIAEKGFYLHPSPLSTPRGADPPELLPLFPLTSPKQQSKPSDDDKVY